MENKKLTYNRVITDFHGRLDRSGFICLIIINVLLNIVVDMFNPSHNKSLPYVENLFKILTLIYGFLLYIYICAVIKRLRDIGWSCWWTIVGLIPILNLYIIISCMVVKSKITDDVIIIDKPKKPLITKEGITTALSFNIYLFLIYGMTDWSIICIQKMGWLGLLSIGFMPVTIFLYPVYLFLYHKIIAFSWFVVSLTAGFILAILEHIKKKENQTTI